MAHDLSVISVIQEWSKEQTQKILLGASLICEI